MKRELVYNRNGKVHKQIVKRGKHGRFESYMTKDQWLSVLVGILFIAVLVFLWII